MEKEKYVITKLVLLEMDNVVPYESIMGEEDSNVAYVDALDIVATLSEVATLQVGQHVTLHMHPERVVYHDGGEQRLDYYLDGKSGTIKGFEAYTLY